MDRKRITILFIGASIGVVAVVLLWMLIQNYQYRNKIPKLSESVVLSQAMESQIQDAFTAAKKKPSAENLGSLGMVYHSGAFYEQAAQCYQLAIKRKGSEWKWNYYNGYLNMEMGDAGAAIQNFKEVVEKDPENYHAWYYLGEEYKNVRNTEMAEEAYNHILSSGNKTSVINSSTRNDHFPLSTYAQFKLSRLYFDTGRIEHAEETLKKLIQNDYLFGSAYRLLGTIHHTKGDRSLGNKYTNRANDLIAFTTPVDTLADKLAAMSRSELYLLKKIDEAERSIHSDWALKLVNQGLAYLPENRDLFSKAIKIYLWKGYFDKAAALTDNHINSFSNQYIEIKNTGMLFYQKSQYHQAAKYWKKALELKPDESIVQIYLAQSLWADGAKQEARDLLDKMIASNRNNPEVLADITNLLYDFGEADKAAGLLSRLKKQSPHQPKVLRLSGQRAEADGETHKSLTLYKASLEGDPADIVTIRKLGDLLMNQNQWEQYINHYRKALEHHPNNPEMLGRLGEALISCPDTALRNVEEGKEFSERAFTSYTCPPDVLISAGSHLAYAYALLGDKQNAAATISKTITIGRREKIDAASQEKLENFYRTLQAINN